MPMSGLHFLQNMVDYDSRLTNRWTLHAMRVNSSSIGATVMVMQTTCIAAKGITLQNDVNHLVQQGSSGRD